jgi:glyceraldehyde-3-phosphate dehydrogenase/erythrose-4-phosphate dehydrogenase
MVTVHATTGSQEVLDRLPDAGGGASSTLQVPITQAVVYGWYDNELGSFTNMMGERTIAIAKGLLEG